jgi:hypothetical protein
LRDRRIARPVKIHSVAIGNVFYLQGARSMNVTGPSPSHAMQTSSHTLPIKHGTDNPAAETAAPTNPKTAPSNPAHLGNRVDTTA